MIWCLVNNLFFKYQKQWTGSMDWLSNYALLGPPNNGLRYIWVKICLIHPIHGQAVLSLVVSSDNSNYLLIWKFWELINRNLRYTLMHCWRKKNQCANFLIERVVGINNMHIFCHPPNELDKLDFALQYTTQKKYKIKFTSFHNKIKHDK